ncbi:MAG: low-specificity L-threonine aldolase [Candidatus Neomarinimicrobiota bacterium]
MNPIVIDLRSDTVTKPTPGMREAMFRAEVGDDVYNEDPTVNELQRRVASLLGKEDALFVASGTMSNQVAIKSHTQPGQEMICESECHIFNYEASGAAFHSLVQIRPIKGRAGVLDIEEVKSAIRPDNIHAGKTSLITIENTHNRAGGTIYPIASIESLSALAKSRGILLHLDGARLMNAVVATGITAKKWAEYFDSVSICFSKGLGAPVGSVISGSTEFIQKAKRYRKIFGGGMRQAGILAAACIYALDHHIDRLAEDHQNAKELALGLSQIQGVKVDMDSVETNMVMIYVRHPKFNAESLSAALRERGIGMNPVNSEKLRAVTHLDITNPQIYETVNVFKQILK